MRPKAQVPHDLSAVSADVILSTIQNQRGYFR